MTATVLEPGGHLSEIAPVRMEPRLGVCPHAEEGTVKLSNRLCVCAT